MSSCYAGSLVKLTLFTVVITTFVMSGCCKQVQFTPQQPNSVRGWQEFDDGVITAMGEFFLRKGEKIDNGHFGVELIKTVAPQKCYEPFAENILIPHAVLRFYEVSTKRTILEMTGLLSTHGGEPPVLLGRSQHLLHGFRGLCLHLDFR